MSCRILLDKCFNGFCKFYIGTNAIYLRPRYIHKLSKLRSFESLIYILGWI